MATEHDEIITELRLVGQAQYARGIRTAATSVQNLDKTTGRAARSIGNQTTQIGRSFEHLGDAVWRNVKRGGFALGTLGGAVGLLGLKYNAMIEDAEVSNETFLGSAKASKLFTKQLVALDQAIPALDLPQLLQGSRMLLNAGVSADTTVKRLRNLGDAISVIGNKQDEFNRITYALGQIGSGTNVQADEFRQLADTGVTSFARMGKQFGMSGQDFKKAMAEGKIGTKEFFKLFDRDLGRFEGGAQRASRTFSGQVGQMGVAWNRTMGKLSEPLFKELRDNALPEVNAFATNVQTILSNQGLTTQEKLRQIFATAKAQFGPMARDIGDTIRQADIPGQIATALDYVLPKISSAFDRTAPKIAASFFNAFLHSSAFTQGAILLAIGAKFKVFRGIGANAARFFMESWGIQMSSKATTTQLETSGTKAGKTFGRAAGGAAALLVAAELYNLVHTEAKQHKGLAQYSGSKGWGELWRDTGDRFKDFGSWLGKRIIPDPRQFRPRQHGGPVVAHSPYVVGEKGPELFIPNVSGNIKPNLGGVTIVVQSLLDGRLVAQNTAKHNFNELARR